MTGTQTDLKVPRRRHRLHRLRESVGMSIRVIGIAVDASAVWVTSSIPIGVSVGGAVWIAICVSIGAVRVTIRTAMGCTVAVEGLVIVRIVQPHLDRGLPALVVFRPDRRDEVDEEAEDIECIDQGDYPFQYSGCVQILLVLRDPEC